MKKLIAVLTLVAGLAFIGGAPANANSLVSSTPASGETLESAPSAVSITTELPIMDAGNDIAITDSSGNRVDDGTYTIAENTVVVGLKSLTKAGIYTVSYTLLAENDVPLVGSFRFTYAQPQVISSPTAQPTPTVAPAPSGNNAGTTLFVLGLLLASLVVTVALARYARKIFSEK